MSCIIRILKTPDFVTFWHIWEGAGDAGEIIIKPGAERTFTLTHGTLRVSAGAAQDPNGAFQNYLNASPGYARNKYVDTPGPAIFPMMEGHWIAEAVGGPAQGWCHIPLDVDRIEAVIGSRVVANQLLGGDWDGPYHVHYDVVQSGQIDPTNIGRVIQGRRIIDAEMLLDGAYNDLQTALTERRRR